MGWNSSDFNIKSENPLGVHAINAALTSMDTCMETTL